MTAIASAIAWPLLSGRSDFVLSHQFSFVVSTAVVPSLQATASPCVIVTAETSIQASPGSHSFGPHAAIDRPSASSVSGLWKFACAIPCTSSQRVSHGRVRANKRARVFELDTVALSLVDRERSLDEVTCLVRPIGRTKDSAKRQKRRRLIGRKIGSLGK